MSNKIIHRVSKLFQPLNVIPKNINNTNVNHKGYNLMVDRGIIKNVSPGMYALLPLGLKSLQKLINIVDNEMTAIGAQKIQLPVLTSTALWKKSNRFETVGQELFHVRDRHNTQFIMSPTYEEMITQLLSEVEIKTSMLPLLLYQISSKWRDELKPRLGLLRGREFVMKDLYSFDANIDSSQDTYNLVCKAYSNIFKQIGIDFVKAIGDPGIMGGDVSHEYHYLSQTGEDKLHLCSTCNYAINKVISSSQCPICNTALSDHDAVEVGHTFLLNTKYTDIFNTTFKTDNKNIPLIMGCYGLGLTRILATCIEILSTSVNIRWPMNLAPYNVCIIGPKKGSKEEDVSHYVFDIYDILSQLRIDTIVDDRTKYTIGRRMLDANMTGYPFVIIVGKLAKETQPVFEVHDVYNSTCENLSIEGIKDYFSKQYTDYPVKRTMVC